MRYQVLPAVKIGVVMFFPWFLAPLSVASACYPEAILTLAAILYTLTIKDDPNSWLYRLSALAATALGFVFALYGSNIIGQKVFLGDLFKGTFSLTALAMLTILFANDVASVAGVIRKRSKKAQTKGALTQRFPAVAVVICAVCALAAATLPIYLVLLRKAIGFPPGFLSLMESFFMPAFVAVLYFRLLPKAHKRYIPVSFFVAGIVGSIITWVMIQNVSDIRNYLNYRSAGFIVFAIVSIADLILISRNSSGGIQRQPVTDECAETENKTPEL